MLVQVTAPHFCAGLVLEDDRVIDAAPILRWAIGKGRDELRAQLQQKRWKAIVVTEGGQHAPMPQAIIGHGGDRKTAKR